MKQTVWMAAVLLALSACAGSAQTPQSSASDLGRSIPGQTSECEGCPSDPGYPSPVSAFGVLVEHGGQWRLLSDYDTHLLPDGDCAAVAYLGRDCEEGVPGTELHHHQCDAVISLVQLGENPATVATHDFMTSLEGFARMSALNSSTSPPDWASFRWSVGGLQGGLVYTMLTDHTDEASGIMAIGEWAIGERTNEYEEQFTQIVSRLEFESNACGRANCAPPGVNIQCER